MIKEEGKNYDSIQEFRNKLTFHHREFQQSQVLLHLITKKNEAHNFFRGGMGMGEKRNEMADVVGAKLKYKIV